MTDEIYTVEIVGPQGKKIVTLPASQVNLFSRQPGHSDRFATATWLAYCDLWTRNDEPANLQQADSVRAGRAEVERNALSCPAPQPAQEDYANAYQGAPPSGA